jgi:hypothetical protein
MSNDFKYPVQIVNAAINTTGGLLETTVNTATSNNESGQPIIIQAFDDALKIYVDGAGSGAFFTLVQNGSIELKLTADTFVKAATDTSNIQIIIFRA